MRSVVFGLVAFAAIETQAHTFQTCEVPRFEWAAYGNRVTGRMYGMTAAVNDNHIFAGGFLKSTLEDPEAEGFVESTADYAVTGPYTTSDWDGTNAKTITVDLQSYPTTGGAKENAGGSWRAYEAGVVKIDKTTCEHLAQAMCSAAEHHPRCWAALCLTLGPLVSPKTVWMPIRQSTVMRPGLRLTTSQKKEEPSRVFPKPRHHAIAVVMATFTRSQFAAIQQQSQHDAEVEGRQKRTS